MSDFTVPTLSLSGSRAKRQSMTSVPTRDQGQFTSSHSYQPGMVFNQQSKYYKYESNQHKQPSQPVRRTHIFPPRHPNTSQEVPPKDINKNVYLHSPEVPSITHQNTNFSYNSEVMGQYEPVSAYQGMTHSSSRRGLLTNPESSKIVREEVNDRMQTKKMDMGKVLFDRKIGKLLSEATFYEEQLNGACKDELSEHLQQLISIKESSIESHRNLIEGLTALIS